MLRVDPISLAALILLAIMLAIQVDTYVEKKAVPTAEYNPLEGPMSHHE
jgi:hypothetical protein